MRFTKQKIRLGGMTLVAVEARKRFKACCGKVLGERGEKLQETLHVTQSRDHDSILRPERCSLTGKYGKACLAVR
jgi:hypothetical protein